MLEEKQSSPREKISKYIRENIWKKLSDFSVNCENFVIDDCLWSKIFRFSE